MIQKWSRYQKCCKTLKVYEFSLKKIQIVKLKLIQALEMNLKKQFYKNAIFFCFEGFFRTFVRILSLDFYFFLDSESPEPENNFSYPHHGYSMRTYISTSAWNFQILIFFAKFWGKKFFQNFAKKIKISKFQALVEMYVHMIWPWWGYEKLFPGSGDSESKKNKNQGFKMRTNRLKKAFKTEKNSIFVEMFFSSSFQVLV